jgi:PKD repeat protein
MRIGLPYRALLKRQVPRQTLLRPGMPTYGAAGNVSPTAAFTSITTLLSVAFTDTSTDSDGTIASWLWDFGDSATSTLQNPTHAYTTAGAKTVRLTVTDNGGATNFVEHVVTPDVTRDGPTSWRVPQSAADFTALGLAAPDYLWLCQEGSGDLVSTIGTLNLTATSSPSYQNSIAGWTRKFVGTDGSTASQSFRTSSALLDMALGSSAAMIAYGSFTTVAVARTFMALSGANDRLAFSANTGFLRSLHNGVAVDGTVAQGGITTVHQFCWYRNGTSNVSGAVSDTDAVLGTHNESARTGTVKGIGDTAATTPLTARYGWVAIFLGANAERDFAAYLTTLRG